MKTYCNFLKKMLLALFLFTGEIYAQSPNWTIPPSKLSNFNSPPVLVSPLPVAASNAGAIVYYGPAHPTLPIDNYLGNISGFTHSAQVNPVTGKLLFFVIDGIVYDAKGNFIGAMYGEAMPGSVFAEDVVLGASEVAIVADPANCKRFYLFSTMNTSQIKIGQFIHGT